jgi:hypothetical protein
MVISDVHRQRKPNLPQMVLAGGILALGLRSGERGEQQYRQQSDDGDHHKQLDEGEGVLSGLLGRPPAYRRFHLHIHLDSCHGACSRVANGAPHLPPLRTQVERRKNLQIFLNQRAESAGGG